jgi:predicted TIM-barrel fold metal-dependent hydrolase
MAMRIDVHQHLWTEPLVAALERRTRLPFVRREGPLCIVHVAGETPSAVDLEAERPAARAALFARDGVDRAVVAISSPLGIEALPRAEARELIDAHLDGLAEVGESFGAWGPLPLDGIAATDVDAVLARGCVGVSLPAGALSVPSQLEVLNPVLARIEQLKAPLFIHPGPGLAQRLADPSLTDPLWWPALTRYVAQMQAAWLALSALARREHPGLRIVYAMLAGGAPLLSERLSARGGPDLKVGSEFDFYDTSSYGPAAVSAMAQRVGLGRLLHGSDRPVAEPLLTGFDTELRENGAWLAGAQVAA